MHKDANNIVRYVGKGSGDRSKSRKGRNKLWNIIFKNTKPIIEIVSTELTECEALTLEKKLIEAHIKTICNSKYSHNVAKEINIDELKEYVYYSETSKTGLRYTKSRYSGRHRACLIVAKDDEAGSIDKDGYWSIKICGITYKVHRLILELHGIKLSKDDVVNHKDSNPSNNLLSNLELSNTIHNNRNKKLYCSNKTGMTSITTRCVSGINYLIYTVSYLGRRKQFCISLRDFKYDTALSVLSKTREDVEIYLNVHKVFDKSIFENIFIKHKESECHIQ